VLPRRVLTRDVSGASSLELDAANAKVEDLQSRLERAEARASKAEERATAAEARADAVEKSAAQRIKRPEGCPRRVELRSPPSSRPALYAVNQDRAREQGAGSRPALESGDQAAALASMGCTA
jgi:septal ring factor EnvC (AmiA/AmiB activator)